MLAERFDRAKLPHDLERTRAVAWWAYEQGERAGAHAWIEKNRFAGLDASWRFFEAHWAVGREEPQIAADCVEWAVAGALHGVDNDTVRAVPGEP